jgi:hypothetical protein
VSRTNRVLEAIREECERRRAAIDDDDGLRSVSIIVKLDASGEPREVMFRIDAGRELARATTRKAS